MSTSILLAAIGHLPAVNLALIVVIQSMIDIGDR